MYRRIIVAICLAVCVLAAITAAILFTARRSLESGATELRLAQSDVHLVQARSSLKPVLERVRAHVELARSDFASANDRLALVAPVIEHLGWVPRVGSELAVAPAIARTATQTTEGTLSLVNGLFPLANRWHTSSSRGRIPVLLQGLALGHHSFVQASRQLADAGASRRSIPTGSYPASLTSALHSLDDQLPRLTTLSRTLLFAPGLLGASRPTSYLVAYQNSAELRATGGFIGSASVVTVHKGVTSLRFEDTGIRDNVSVPPPEPVAYYNDEIGWLFRDSNWSPDFPTSAALERFFYKLDFHQDVPNVVDLTPQAASDILTTIGPLYVPEYRRTVNGGNVAQLADYYAHWATKPGPINSGGSDTQRKQFIGIVARQVLRRIGSLTPKTLIDLGQAVSTAVAHGDVLLNFRDPSLQSLIQKAGASHEVTPLQGDYLYVVNTNLSYNKINAFVHLTSAYDVRIRPDRWLDARLTVRLRNVPAPVAFQRVSLGPQAGRYGNWDDYATFLRIYTPPGAELIDQTGWTQPWSQGPAYGGTMFSGYLIVPHGTTRTVRLHYIVPPNVFRATHGNRYTLLVPHQPGSVPDALQVTLRHDGVQSNWKVTHPSLDWSVSVPINAQSFHPIPLPRIPPPATEPGGWIEPHAFLAAPNPRG